MKLLEPLPLGDITLQHRIVMAPLTRMRAAEPDKSPWEIQAEMYQQRASAGGLLIAEATQISQQGQGYPSTPGCFLPEHVKGWRVTTDAVHKKQGFIYLQLWHVGRISHPVYQEGNQKPVSASDVPPAAKAIMPGSGALEDCGAPRPLRLEELPGIVEAYRNSAQCAKDAGFDGVELHAANGYLVDQFLNNQVNLRTDDYGGSVENRSRLLFEVLEAICGVWGPGRVGIRLSPHQGVGPNDARDSDPEAIYTHVLRQLSARFSNLSFVHIIETTRPWRTTEVGETPEMPILRKYRPLYSGRVIGASGFSPASAEVAVKEGLCDAIAFGRIFISTPDLPERIRRGEEPNKYDRNTFYTVGTVGKSKADLAVGYTSYPTIDAATKDQLLPTPKL